MVMDDPGGHQDHRREVFRAVGLLVRRQQPRPVAAGAAGAAAELGPAVPVVAAVVLAGPSVRVPSPPVCGHVPLVCGPVSSQASV